MVPTEKGVPIFYFQRFFAQVAILILKNKDFNSIFPMKNPWKCYE